MMTILFSSILGDITTNRCLNYCIKIRVDGIIKKERRGEACASADERTNGEDKSKELGF